MNKGAPLQVEEAADDDRVPAAIRGPAGGMRPDAAPDRAGRR